MQDFCLRWRFLLVFLLLVAPACDGSGLAVSECSIFPNASGCAAEIILFPTSLGRDGGELTIRFSRPADTMLFQVSRPAFAVEVRQADKVVKPRATPTMNPSGEVVVTFATELLDLDNGAADVALTINGKTVSAKLKLYRAPNFVMKHQIGLKCVPTDAAAVCFSGLRRSPQGGVQLFLAKFVTMEKSTVSLYSVKTTGIVAETNPEAMPAASLLCSNNTSLKHFISGCSNGNNAYQVRDVTRSNYPVDLGVSELKQYSNPEEDTVISYESSSLGFFRFINDTSSSMKLALTDVKLLGMGYYNADRFSDIIALTRDAVVIFNATAPLSFEGPIKISEIRVDHKYMPGLGQDSIKTIALTKQEGMNYIVVGTDANAVAYAMNTDNSINIHYFLKIEDYVKPEQMFFIDIDGDGKDELVLISERSLRIYQNINNGL